MTNNYRRNLRESVPALTTTLFLGDLSVLCNEFHVRELFSRYGELERVQLKKSDRDPHRAHLGFGFVKFSSRASAERALEELNGYFFMGRALRVGWADDYNRVGGEVKARDPKKNRETAQLHVSFVCEDSCRMVSEMELGLVFGVFGNVVDIAIKKNVLNKVSGVQSGYAFVHFALTLGGLESAFSAAERVNERMIDGIRYKCKTDQALLMQYMSLKSCNGSEPFKAQTLKIKSAFIPVPVAASTTRYSERSTHDVTYHPEPFLHVGSDSNYWSEERPGNPAIPLDTHALRFSTYGSSVEDQIVYSSPLSSDVSFLKAKRDQQYIDKSVMHNEPSSVTQRFSSATDNDFLRLLVLPFSRSPSSSLSSSSSYDEVPFHPRYATMYHHTSQE